jgi:excisionase family DNA binding protein
VLRIVWVGFGTAMCITGGVLRLCLLGRRVGDRGCRLTAILIVMSDEWFSVRDIARKMGRSQPTVRRAIGRGELTAHVMPGGRGYLVSPCDLESFIAKCRTDSGDVAEGAAGRNEDHLAEASLGVCGAFR